MGAPVTDHARMSSPAHIRTTVGTHTRAATVPAQRGGATQRGATQRGATQRGATVRRPAPEPVARTAAARAYAKRDERTKRRVGSSAERVAAAGRPRFVLVMMVLLALGLVATLWLSTAAAADSYRLEDARLAAREMSEQSERLHREVATMASPTSLAERASGLGMVPVQDSARLVVDPVGEVRVVGTPRAAVAPAPPAPPPCAATAPAPPAAARGTAPAAVADRPLTDCVSAAEPVGSTGPDQAGPDQAGSDQTGSDQAGSDQSEPVARRTGGTD